jgi:hypothetical protein
MENSETENEWHVSLQGGCGQPVEPPTRHITARTGRHTPQAIHKYSHIERYSAMATVESKPPNEGAVLSLPGVVMRTISQVKPSLVNSS